MDPQEHERYRAFVDARWGALPRVANLLTGGDRHEAEGLVQIALMKALGRWRHTDDPEGYVRKVTYRRRPTTVATFPGPSAYVGTDDGAVLPAGKADGSHGHGTLIRGDLGSGKVAQHRVDAVPAGVVAGAPQNPMPVASMSP
ncbi:hypothetical protein [Streptomyces sp. NPDC054842]